MQQKLKSVFRRSSKSRNSSGSHEQLDDHSHYSEASPPRTDRQRASSDTHGRASIDSSATGSVHASRSRPVSSIYDDHRHSHPSARHTAGSEVAFPADSNGGAIANDYKAYLPVLSPVNDDHGDEYMAPGGDGQHITRGSEARHEEDVADRNIARYSTSIDGEPRSTADITHNNGSSGASHAAPVSRLTSSPVDTRKPSASVRSSGFALDSVPNGSSVARHTLGDTFTTNGGLIKGIPHTDLGQHDQNSLEKSTFPSQATRTEHGRETGKHNVSKSNEYASWAPNKSYETTEPHGNLRHATVNGTADGEETALARKLREDGVADLRNTVDTDGDITWAPAVTHEVIKPHQHEIIQRKIYREIHNYEHFHRIQPVMMTEVLPPRHWIPNPNGEGLIEISADELPARTGDNRWWSICEHSSPYSRQETLPKYRTEPEIIEAGTFMTEAGFERKETIIIHPPTLADLTGYGGPVQAMHFDHKTGKSWMGELTTMDKLHQLQRELDRAPDSRAFDMDGLDKALPKLPLDSTRRGSTSMPLRKPVSGHSSELPSSNAA